MNNKKNDHKIFVLFIYLFTISILMFTLYYLTDDSIVNTTIIGFFIYFLVITSWYVSSKSLLDVYTFFIVLSFIFYLGQPLLMFFDISFDIVMSIGSSPYDSTQINKTLKFLLTSIAVFHGSVLVYQVFSNVFHRKKYFSTNDENDYLLKSFRYVGIFLFLISVIPQFMYIYESIKTTILFGYSNIFKSDYIIGSGVQGGIPRFLAEFFKSALLLITISYLNDKKRLKRWIVFSILYSILLIVSGQRGSNTLFIFSLFFLYHFGVKKINIKKISYAIIFLIITVYSLSIISVIRNIGIANYSFSELINFFSDINPFIDLLAESGFTLIACTTVVVYAPSIVPYNYGETYINSLIALVPNFFWDVNPAAIGGVDQVFKNFLFKDSGIGSSFIIEAYYNFGLYGVFMMPVFGLFIYLINKNLINFKFEKNYYNLFISVYCIPVFLWFVRSETINIWRDLGYHVFFPLFLVFLCNKFLLRKSLEFSYSKTKF